MIRLLADECVYKATISLLKAQSYDVISIRDLGKSGSPDGIVIKEADKSNRILLTVDQDFGNIIAYPPEVHKGIIILKLSKNDAEVVQGNLLKMLAEVDAAALSKSLVIVDKNKYRIRRK